ncbi:Uncharacterized protein Fot_31989 [Forsythia ovata]|uniref:Uncharacterized protein n=1 Tax=Forsythia ovata TaxID=205694 RepID=A0ABD1T6K2_9LAMI
MKMIIFLAFALFLQGSLGELVCEELPVGLCSFSIASSGKRCLLETFASNDGTLEFQCKTSEVVAINLHEYIEADECVSACGVDRKSVGISSDSLLDSQFTAKLCSPQCYQNCPNIVDLYYNLAIGEGDTRPVGFGHVIIDAPVGQKRRTLRASMLPKTISLWQHAMFVVEYQMRVVNSFLIRVLIPASVNGWDNGKILATKLKPFSSDLEDDTTTVENGNANILKDECLEEIRA